MFRRSYAQTCHDNKSVRRLSHCTFRIILLQILVTLRIERKQGTRVGVQEEIIE